jgi:dipicolinate synthase subunit B
MLLNYKNIYFVPFRQDDCINKPNSLVADMSKIKETLEAALDRKQLQPVLC